MDLLFYHRKLRRLVVIDLKIGKFQAADKGQMELYLHWLEENEMQPGEEPPLGLVLCAGKTEGHVRLLRLEESGIHAAQYLTELLPRELLEKKLHDAIRLARERLARQAERPAPAKLAGSGETGRRQGEEAESKPRERCLTRGFGRSTIMLVEGSPEKAEGSQCANSTRSTPAGRSISMSVEQRLSRICHMLTAASSVLASEQTQIPVPRS